MKNLLLLFMIISIEYSCRVIPFTINTPNCGRTTLITVHPANKQIAYLVSGAGLLFKTTNEGLTWQRQHISFRVVDIKFDPYNYDRLVATAFNVNGNSRGGIYVSINGGRDWAKPPSLNRAIEGHGISFVEGRVLIGTNEGIAISNDLENWTLSQPFSSGNQTILSVIDRGNNQINAAGSQGVVYSNNNGQTWDLSTGAISENVDIDHNIFANRLIC